jgi:hypothetical protein
MTQTKEELRWAFIGASEIAKTRMIKAINSQPNSRVAAFQQQRGSGERLCRREVVGIFQFTNVWNDFLFSVTILPNPVAQPVTVALNNLSGSYSVDWNVVMAGAVIAARPTALVYIFLGRFFVRALLAGSVKG